MRFESGGNKFDSQVPAEQRQVNVSALSVFVNVFVNVPRNFSERLRHTIVNRFL